MESRKTALMNLFVGQEIQMQIQRMDLWTQWGRERVGQMEKAATTYIHYGCKMDSWREAAV